MTVQFIAYYEAGNDHDANPFRYTLEYVYRTIDTSIFSRGRKTKPIANSPF